MPIKLPLKVNISPRRSTPFAWLTLCVIGQKRLLLLKPKQSFDFILSSGICSPCLGLHHWKWVPHQRLWGPTGGSHQAGELWILQSIACLRTRTDLLIILTESFSYKSKIYLLLAALERSQLSKLLCCYHMDGWDSLDLCELASKEVVFSERGAYPSPLNSKL